MRYVAVDVGCLECGEESYVLGVFDREEDAVMVAEECASAQNAHWGGQHDFRVFPVAHDNALCCIPDYADRNTLSNRMRELGIEVV